MDVQVKNTRVAICRGDLLELPAEVIVVPASTTLEMRIGVAEAAYHQGGSVIEDEALRSRKGVHLGDVIETTAGRLPFRAVYHAVVVSKDANRNAISRAVHEALCLADRRRVKSIAFPMLGSSRYKGPYDTYARLMIRTTFEYLSIRDTDLLEVVFCLYNMESYSLFKDQLTIVRQEFLI